MFTIFGHSGFLGLNLVKNLKKEKIFLPPRNRFIFKKNLGHIIYCIGSYDWKKDPINSFDANLCYLPLIIRNNKPPADLDLDGGIFLLVEFIIILRQQQKAHFLKSIQLNLMNIMI